MGAGVSVWEMLTQVSFQTFQCYILHKHTSKSINKSFILQHYFHRGIRYLKVARPFLSDREFCFDCLTRVWSRDILCNLPPGPKYGHNLKVSLKYPLMFLKIDFLKNHRQIVKVFFQCTESSIGIDAYIF